MKITIPSDICTGIENLFGLKLFGLSDTLTDASTPIDDIYKKSEIQNEEQYQINPYKFPSH